MQFLVFCLTLDGCVQSYTALPVLYASQWFLTCFSCPFPAKFACRVIDVMLQEQRAHVLLRVALAIVAEVEAEILELHDFEDIITYLKVSFFVRLKCPGKLKSSYPSKV